jgi:hypothetical protein
MGIIKDMVNHDRIDMHPYTIRTCKKRRDRCWRGVNAVQVDVVEVQLLSRFFAPGKRCSSGFLSGSVDVNVRYLPPKLRQGFNYCYE